MEEHDLRPLGGAGYVAAPQRQCLTTATPGVGHVPRDKTARDQVEDKIRQTIDAWTEAERATAYWYLYASGMNLEKAKVIRRKAGFVS